MLTSKFYILLPLGSIYMSDKNTIYSTKTLVMFIQYLLQMNITIFIKKVIILKKGRRIFLHEMEYQTTKTGIIWYNSWPNSTAWKISNPKYEYVTI